MKMSVLSQMTCGKDVRAPAGWIACGRTGKTCNQDYQSNFAPSFTTRGVRMTVGRPKYAVFD